MAGRVEEASGPLAPLLELARALGPGAGSEVEHVLGLVGTMLITTERWVEGTALLEQVVHRSRTAALTPVHAYAAANLAEVRWREGRWDDAWHLMVEVVPPGATMRASRAWATAMRAHLAATRGDADACRGDAEAALAAVADLGYGTVDIWAGHALGALALAHGDDVEAARRLDRVAAVAAGGGLRLPGACWWQGDHLEALVRTGRRRDAVAALARLDEDALGSRSSWAAAVAARARCMLATDTDTARTHAAEALALHERLPTPFERARTLLALARRLGPGQADAAAAAWEARGTFASLGASAWVARADEVLGPDDAELATLTPAERRVALAVGRGLSNKEAADELYVSIRTVDFHLGSVYRSSACGHGPSWWSG